MNIIVLGFFLSNVAVRFPVTALRHPIQKPPLLIDRIVTNVEQAVKKLVISGYLLNQKSFQMFRTFKNPKGAGKKKHFSLQ